MIAKFPVDFRNLGTEVPAATRYTQRALLTVIVLVGGTTHLTRRQIILAAWADTAHRHLELSFGPK
jgi:hypothetical protein